jgi:hypothetical protein
MATIVIKDLPESTELDRQAMHAIAGGSRLRTGAKAGARVPAQRVRLFDISAGGAGKKTPPTRPPSR